MNDELMRWRPDRRSRAHVNANVIVAICLLTILALGAFYVIGGTP